MDFLAVFTLLFVESLQIISSLGGNLYEIQNKIPKFTSTNSRQYQVIKPVFIYNQEERKSTQTKDGHLSDVILHFQAFSKNFTIDLAVNRYLFSKSYIEKSLGANGKSVIRKPKLQKTSHCFYHGSIRGVPHSIAAVSTCDGVSGLISDRKRTYHIEPSYELGAGRHKLYIDVDSRPTGYQGCGDHDEHSILLSNATINSLHTREVLKRMRRSIRGPYDGNENTRYVEMFLVNDYRTYRKYQDEATIIKRSQDIVNIVSKLYNPLNIIVALVGVEIWKSRDMFSISARANDTLGSFLNYRQTDINPYHQNDNAQLITGQSFDSKVLGRAKIRVMCSNQYSGGVTTDIDKNLVQVATTVAHELGHNFGMDHDNYSVCRCSQDKCIMAPTGGGLSTPTEWSSCSRTALLESFDIGMDYCLRNKPEKIYDGPVCGNGFVEKGEQCDCGLPENCKTRCCNASSCKLMPGAQCATGQCCDINTCQPKPAASLCRGAYEECDLAEFCDGKSEWCPSNVYRQNGVSCAGGQSYCYNGKCNTPTGQCKLLWGSTGRVSDPICFQHLNTNGSKHGNCGYNWASRTYIRCDKEDVMCGLLHCVHLNEKLMFWRETLAVATPATFLTKGSKQYVCRSAVLDVGLDMPDPGQVPEGAKCGNNKICVDHKCTSLSRLTIPSCQDCHGNGVCNSIGQCHCNEGFAPPLCNEPGHGGSLHSGPVKVKDSNAVMIGILVSIVILFLIGLLAGLGYYYREDLKKWWKNRPQELKYRVPCVSLKPRKPPPRSPSRNRNPPPNIGSSRNNGNVSIDISVPVLQDSTNSQSNHTTKPLIPKPNKKPPQLKESSNTTPGVKSNFPKPEPLVPPKPEFKPSPKTTQKALPKLPQKTQNAAAISLATKSDPIVKKEPITREISNPVLISTTNRKSQAFVGVKLNGEGVDIPQPPPVPPPTKGEKPARPKSMPPQQQKDKLGPDLNKKPENRKSVVDSTPKCPERPPPPSYKEGTKGAGQTKTTQPSKNIIDKNKYKIEADLEETKLSLAKNRSPAKPRKNPLSGAESKAMKPLLSTNSSKTAADSKIKKKDFDGRGNNTNSKAGKATKPLPSLPKQDGAQNQEPTQDSPGVAHIKAMFDSMDVGNKVSDTNSSSGAGVVRNNSGAGDRPKPPPKPSSGAKIRSVNV